MDEQVSSVIDGRNGVLSATLAGGGLLVAKGPGSDCC